MKFADLEFVNDGCCGSHNWAEVKHKSGVITRVYDNGDGTYDVATSSAMTLIRGQERYATPADVQKRLNEDAKI